MNRRMLALFCALAAFVVVPQTVRAEGWLVLPPLDFYASGDLALGKSTNLIVSSTVVGTRQITMSLPVTFPSALGTMIDSIAVCYKTSNARTFISQTRLIQLLGPSLPLLVFNDATDRASTVDECYVSQVPNYAPQGAMILWLGLNFGNISDTIAIGGIGIHFR